MSSPPTVAAIVFAAGRGERFGGRKQFADLNGERLVDRVVRRASAVADPVVLVLPDGVTWDGPPVATVASGGASHGASVANGLAALHRLDRPIDIVVLASPSHPLAGPGLFASVVQAVFDGADAAAPAARLPDALKRREGDLVVGSVDKSDLVSVQAPGAFRYATLQRALAEGGEAPEELELIERIGGVVRLVEGEITNLHITTPEDLAMARLVDQLVDERPA